MILWLFILPVILGVMYLTWIGANRWVDSALPKSFGKKDEKEVIFHWLPHVQESYAKVLGLSTPKCFCSTCGIDGAYVDFQPDVLCAGCKAGMSESEANWRENPFSYEYSPVCDECANTSIWRVHNNAPISGSSLNQSNWKIPFELDPSVVM